MADNRITREKYKMAVYILSGIPYTPTSGKYQQLLHGLTRKLSHDELYFIVLSIKELIKSHA